MASADTAAVTNVNDAPLGLPAISGSATEDQVLGADVSAISDADGLGVLAYQWLRNGAGIGGATATTYTLGDADVGSNISLRVSYTDGGGTLETLTSATLGPVANINDAPVIAVNTGLTINEGASGTLISAGMLAAGDPDDAGVGLTYAVTANVANGTLRLNGAVLNVNDTFTQADIDGGRLTYDHDGSETTADSFGFSLADGGEDGAGPVSGSFSITVTPQNGAPAITSNGGGNGAAISVAENTTPVTVVTAVDADLPPDALTYSIVGGADATRFTIDANTGALSFVAPPDFENPTDSGTDNTYDVVVQVSDGVLNDSQAIAVTVSDVGESTVGALSDDNVANNEVAENAAVGTAVGITAHAVDPDVIDSVTYSLDNDAGGRFTIDAGTGVVSVAGAIDREVAANYGVIVRATSSDASFSTASFTIAVLPVNDNAPLITSNGGAANASVAVADSGTAVTNVAASDADLPAQTLAYSISGGTDASLFAIDATTGALRFVAPPSHAAPADSNADNIYQVIVSVSDGSFSDSQTIDVAVQPPGNKPPVITSNGGGAGASTGVAENTTAVTTVIASDTDVPAQTLSYSIAGGADAAKFTIDAGTGVLALSPPRTTRRRPTPAATTSMTCSCRSATAA